MADTRAFTRFIGPSGSGISENNAVHQVSPAWVLTFVRWANRDTFRITTESPTATKDPLVVENDCLQLTITESKSSLTPSLTATLVMTDVNYETAVAPGDFVFANILNWEQDARKVADKARAKQPINGVSDGFKGIFKVQSVRRMIMTDPERGTKTVVFRITAFAFTEFNNTIYFNPYLVDPTQDPKNQFIYLSNLSADWASYVNQKGTISVQNIIAFLIQSFIGQGVSNDGKQDKSGLKTPNTHFFVPDLVGSYLGIQNAKAAKDIYNYLFGLQQYAAGGSATLAAGMNPVGLKQTKGRFLYTPVMCEGDTIVKPEYWNQVKAWAILNQFTNAPLNEMYTCHRIDPSGKIMPTLVFRQIPFTNEDFATKDKSNGTIGVTKFLSLPRWKLSTALIFEEDIGREEAARINFIQYFGKSTVSKNGADISLEIAQKNYLYDQNDVQRSGLRPYVVTSQFDEIGEQNKLAFRSPYWAKILADSLFGGHLKMNGSINCAGIQDPIAVGDNLEMDGTVYHIEQITHSCSNGTMDGKSIFRTVIRLSNGISIASNEQGVRYPQMNNTSADSERALDAKNLQKLPGVSESQDVIYRPASPDLPTSPNGSFAQPSGGTDFNKLGEGKDE